MTTKTSTYQNPFTPSPHFPKIPTPRPKGELPYPQTTMTTQTNTPFPKDPHSSPKGRPSLNPNKMITLDLKDKKLLTALDENARFTNTQLAKKVGLSKPAVEYRLKRFEKNKIIFNHYSVIDFTKLGYSQYKIYCQHN